MAIRKDAGILAGFVRSGALFPKEAEDRIRLPLLELNLGTLLDKIAFMEYSEKYFREKGPEGFSELFFASMDMFILEDFMALLGDSSDGYTYCRVKTSDDRIRWIEYFGEEYKDYYFRWQIVEKDGRVAMASEGAFRKGGVSRTDFSERTSKKLEYLTHLVGRVVSSVLLHMRFCHERDQYCVATESVKKDRSANGTKGRLALVTGPSIVYLDKFPSPSVSERKPALEGADEPAVRKAHHRRGTWRTLKAERFRNHPKFGVEKGVYVKPSWVGDKEAVVEGTIYRLMEV